MQLLEKIDLFLLSEGKANISPYLKSIYTKQDFLSKEGAEAIQKGLSKINTDAKFVITVGVPLGKGKPYVVIKDFDEDPESEAKKVSAVLTKNGFTVVKSEKGDGGSWVVRFK
jgi:formyltetrahydrofolate synthetase